MLPLENVHEQLLRSGIAPRHARRYVTELHEHLTDLEARERASGLDAVQASKRARVLLGSDAQLTDAMIDRGAPRSLAAKAPWAVFGVAPLITLIVTVVLLGRWSIGFLFPYSALSGAEIPESVRAVGVTLSFIGSYVVGPALAAACVVIALRQRLSSRWVWMGLALIAVASGPFGLHIQFLASEGDVPGGIRGSLAPTVFANGQIDEAATLAMIGIRTAVLFGLSGLAYGTLRRRELAA